MFYPKKLGLIRRRITPEAQRRASPIATFTIMSLPHFESPVAIMTPATIIRMNDVIRITLTTIFIRLQTRIGNAVDSLIVDPGTCDDVSMQLPIKGILVFSFVPQQTSGSEHGWQSFGLVCDVDLPNHFLQAHQKVFF